MKNNIGDIVRLVERDKYGTIMFAHAAEVISAPTADRTIMLRRVPGHPGTTIEKPLQDIAPMDTGSYFAHYAEVVGSNHASFPVDMLRYDFCCPYNFSFKDNGSGRIVTAIDPAYGRPDRLIVVKISRKSVADWTVARWNSFGWGCVPVPELSALRVK